MGQASSVAFFVLIAPISVMFSVASRRKLQAVFTVTSNPFWDLAVSLSDMVDDPLVVQIAPVKSLEHNCSEFELLVLGALVKQTQSGNIFEIGTFDGRSTRTLAANNRDEGVVTTLNLPPGKKGYDSGISNFDTLLNLKVESGCRFLDTIEETKIEQVYGDSATYDFRSYEGACDLVFIDGSHNENYVRRDTETALRLVRSTGGLIVWHDAPLYGVVTYLRPKIREENWPLRLVEDTTLMVGYAREGKFIPLVLPLPSFKPLV